MGLYLNYSLSFVKILVLSEGIFKHSILLKYLPSYYYSPSDYPIHTPLLMVILGATVIYRGAY